MARRPDIPSDLERAVLVECGHRCAIPTCRQVPVELAHIVPWAKCKEHKFENLLALCPTCHTRYDHGEIDRKSAWAYKLNLRLANGRYGDLEQRVVFRLVTDRTTEEFWWFADMDILLARLIGDGLLAPTGQTRPVGGLVQNLYRLTDLGREYIALWPVA